MKFKIEIPLQAVIDARHKFLDATKECFEKLSPDEVVAVLAYTTGQALAMMDQRRFSPADGFQLILKNIEAGNRHAIESLLKSSEDQAERPN